MVTCTQCEFSENADFKNARATYFEVGWDMQ